jgi:hypothetical protein
LSYPLDFCSNYVAWRDLDHRLPRMERWAKPKVKGTEMKPGTPKPSRTLSYVDGGDESSSPVVRSSSLATRAPGVMLLMNEK